MNPSTMQAIEELVRSVAHSAAHGKVKVSEKIEALRVLAPYYAALTKHKVPESDDQTSGMTISRLQNAIQQVEDSNGRTVPDYQRRGRTEEAVED